MRLRQLPFLIGLLFAASAMAQTAPQPQAQPAQTGESQGSLASGMTINAELRSSIDSKKLKANDTVTAQTTEKVKSSDGRTILPKGAKLMGHVTQAEARSKGDKESVVAMHFDKATTKDGQEVPLDNVVIQAIAAPPSAGASYSPGPGAPGAGATGTPSNNPSMSGSTGGKTGSGNTGSTPQSSYPGAAGEPESGAAASGPLPPNSQGVYGLQNIKLARANSSNGENSVIISNDKNVRLDSGTRLLLFVEPAQGSSQAPGR